MTVALFAVASLGLLAYKEDYSIAGAFRADTESVEGFEVMQRAFPAGALFPTTVLVMREDAPSVPSTSPRCGADRGRARRRVRPGERTFDRRGYRAAQRRVQGRPVRGVRARAGGDAARARAGRGVRRARALVGDGSAVQADFNAAAAHDLKLIVPLALLVIFVILAVLLEVLVAPLLLIATVVLSFLGTFGLSMVFFRYVLGDTGVDGSLPTYAFIFHLGFMVAIGSCSTPSWCGRSWSRRSSRSRATAPGGHRRPAAARTRCTRSSRVFEATAHRLDVRRAHPPLSQHPRQAGERASHSAGAEAVAGRAAEHL